MLTVAKCLFTVSEQLVDVHIVSHFFLSFLWNLKFQKVYLFLPSNSDITKLNENNYIHSSSEPCNADKLKQQVRAQLIMIGRQMKHFTQYHFKVTEDPVKVSLDRF